MENLSFGKAIEALNEGKQVQRIGWSNEGMFIFKTEGREITKDEFLKFKNGNSAAIELATKLGTHQSNSVKISDHFDLMSADGSIVVGWLASQTDMQATDWKIVEIKKKMSDFRDIKLVEDAFEFLGINYQDWLEKYKDLPADVLAYMQLTYIVKAINGGEWMDYNDTDVYKYYPYFNASGSAGGFSFSDCGCDFVFSVVGSRLVF